MIVLTVLVPENYPVLVADEEAHIVLGLFVLDLSVLGVFALVASVLVVSVLAVFVPAGTVLDVSVLDVYVLDLSVLHLFALDVVLLDVFVLDAFVLCLVVLAVFVRFPFLVEDYAFLVADYPHVFGPAVFVVEVHVGSEAVLANVMLMMDYLVVSEHRGDSRFLVQVYFERATSSQLHDLAW